MGNVSKLTVIQFGGINLDYLSYTYCMVAIRAVKLDLFRIFVHN